MLSGAAIEAPSVVEPNLVIRGLSKSFAGICVLDKVDLDVGYGEIHGLLGQNGSGKSTLIKILGGVHAPDPGGTVFLNGREVPLPLPGGDFSRYGIAIVHQALGLVPSLSVTENLLVRRLVRDRNRFINWSAAHRDAAAILHRYEIDIDPHTVIQSLAPVDRALIAIIRAFEELAENGAERGGLLILDEPTPFLSRTEVERLFRLVRQTAARGCSILFVSHDIDEVMDLTQRATVLRNGRIAANLETASANKEGFISAIVGKSLVQSGSGARLFESEPTIRVSDLAGVGLEKLDLDISEGEIVGLAGLIGSGYDRVPYLLYGAQPAASGKLRIGARTIDLPSMTPKRAIDVGLVLVPADRQGSGIAEGLNIGENIAIPMLGNKLGKWFVTNNAVHSLAKGLVEQFDVRPPDSYREMRSLSGGNQQKVVLAKWFQCNPKLILLDEPTQGVDVGARAQVFSLIREASQRGASVLCSSSDHEQLASICDRVIVFNRGEVVATLRGEDVTKDNISARCYDSDALGMGEMDAHVS